MFVQLAARSPRAVAWHENAFVGNLLSSAASCSNPSSSLFSSYMPLIAVSPFHFCSAAVNSDVRCWHQFRKLQLSSFVGKWDVVCDPQAAQRWESWQNGVLEATGSFQRKVRAALTLAKHEAPRGTFKALHLMLFPGLEQGCSMWYATQVVQKAKSTKFLAANFGLLNPVTMQFAVASVIRQSSGPMPFDVLMSGHWLQL